MAASKMATWCLILLYLIYYPTWECGGLSFWPQQIQTNEWNYHRLILYWQIQDGGIQDGWLELKIAIYQLRLNSEMCGLGFMVQ